MIETILRQARGERAIAADATSLNFASRRGRLMQGQNPGRLGMSKKITLAALAVLTVAAIGLSFSDPASAEYCEDTVHGLSHYYNLATGSGFLAVRSPPSSNSRMLAQLFNGDRVEILGRQGSWYRVFTGSVDGWSYRRWLRNSCGYLNVYHAVQASLSASTPVNSSATPASRTPETLRGGSLSRPY
jgi:hypothetical protein